MKYFSPNILDGSVTTAKIADLAVTSAKLGSGSVLRTKIQAAVSSQSGTIPSSSSVLVSLSPYNFFMDTEMVDGLSGRFTCAVSGTPSASADAPQFNINNLIALAKLYSVEWRNVDL